MLGLTRYTVGMSPQHPTYLLLWPSMYRKSHASDGQLIARSAFGNAHRQLALVVGTLCNLPPSMYPQTDADSVVLVCAFTSSTRLRLKTRQHKSIAILRDVLLSNQSFTTMVGSRCCWIHASLLQPHLRSQPSWEISGVLYGNVMRQNQSESHFTRLSSREVASSRTLSLVLSFLSSTSQHGEPPSWLLAMDRTG